MNEQALNEDHPGEALTAAYLDGTLRGDSLERFEDHLAECDPCRASIHLLREAASSTESAPQGWVDRARGALGGTARRTAAPRWPLWIGAAAAAVVIVAAALWSLSGLIPGPAGGAAYRGEFAGLFGDVEPGPGNAVAFESLAFRWGEVPGADRYVVTVLDARGERLAAVEIRAPQREARWPREAARPAPGPLIWRVQAFALDRAIAETRPIPFEIR